MLRQLFTKEVGDSESSPEPKSSVDLYNKDVVGLMGDALSELSMLSVFSPCVMFSVAGELLHMSCHLCIQTRTATLLYKQPISPITPVSSI